MNTGILIVDDESLIASSLKVFLEDEGLDVITAASGEEAIERLTEDKGVDVCVMDMRRYWLSIKLTPRFALLCILDR